MTTDTEEATTVTRRSQRIREQSSQSVAYDEDINKSGYYEDPEDDDIESEHEGEDKDPDVVIAGKGGRKRKAKTTRGKRVNKKAKNVGNTSVGKSKGTFNELRQDFEESHIFQALSDPEVAVPELAVDWVDQYKENKDLAKKDLVNLILNAVGCFTKIEEHDVNNNESAADTVGEIQTFFKRQKIHEFYLLSKKPEYKHLKKNYIIFINEIIITASEKNALYDNVYLEDEEEQEDENEDDSNIMEDLLIWLSAFSVSSVRSLRYIASVSLFSIESTLCRIIGKNDTSLETFKRQLESEQKKKQTAAIKKRIETIENNVNSYHRQSIILENFIQDIVNTAFIHRFKDIDPSIRTEAMISLGDWMESNPEFFFRVTFLKYLGWVLSDSNSSVRLQVLKTLVRLVKHHSIVSGLRQFLERFKKRIIEISFHDVDHNVRLNAFALLTEINKAGFLEDEEINEVLSLVFQNNEKRLLSQLAHFIQVVEKEKTSEIVDKLESDIEKSSNIFPIDLKLTLKINTLVKILHESLQIRSDPVQSSTPQKAKLEPSNLATFSKSLFNLAQFHDIRELLIDYYLLDLNSIKKLSSTIKKETKLSNDEELILLDLIHGYVLSLNEKDSELSSKEKLNEPETNNESLIQQVISSLPNVLNKIENNELKYSIFIKIFLSLKPTLFETTSAESDAFKSIHLSFLKYFRNNNILNLKDEYVHVFKNLTNTSYSSTIGEVNTSFQNYTSELILEFNNYLKDPEFEVMNPNYDEIYEDYVLKLLVLGLNFNIVDILSHFSNIRDKIFHLLGNIQITKQSKFTTLFQLLISATSWKLNTLLTSNEIYDLEEELSFIPDLNDTFTDVLTDEKDHFPNQIKSTTASIFIDTMIMLFNFFNNYKESGKDNISNVNRFREIDLNSLALSDKLTSALKYIFLTKEAILSSVLKVELERDEDEDVNLNSLTYERDTEDEDDEEVEVDEEEVKWEVEKDLIIYTKKLLSLKRIDLISDEFVKRIKLNEDVLGELFIAIVEEELNEYEEDSELEEEIVQSQPIEKAVRQQSEVDEIENITQPNEEHQSEEEDIPEIEMED